MSRTTRGRVLMLLAVVAWPALEFTGVSLIPPHHPIQVVFLRYVVHLALLLALVLPLRGPAAFRTRRPLLQLLRGVLMFGMPASYVLAATDASGGWVWTVFWTMPLLALAGTVVVEGDRPRAAAWFAAAAGVVAAAAIHAAPPGGAIGSLLALVMAGTFAGYLVLSRVLRAEPLGASLLYTGVGALLPTLLVVWRVWTPVAPADWAPALAVGALSLVILSLFDLSLEAAPASAVVPLLALVPVLELTVLTLVRGASPSPLQALGMAVAVIAVGGWWIGGRNTPPLAPAGGPAALNARD